MSRSHRRPPLREPNDEEKDIIVHVRHCARELDDILQGARRKAQANAQIFVEKTAPSLFRGMDSYVDMYSKLKLKSRSALMRLFHRSRDLDDMIDAQEAIDETEECWRGFLSNLDSEVRISSPHVSAPLPSSIKHVGEHIELSEPQLVNCKTFTEFDLQRTLSQFTSTLLVFQPAYLPDLAVRGRSSEIAKVAADFRMLNVGFVVITWGPENVVRSWSKHLSKHVSWPVLWDRNNYFSSFFFFKRGCASLWAPEVLDFCACQSLVYKCSLKPLPIDIDWGTWNSVGGEVLVTNPTVSRLLYQRSLEADTNSTPESDGMQSSKPLATNTSFRICLLHRADNIAHLPPPGSVYQAALTCYAASRNESESVLIEEIRMHRRLATPPDPTRFQLDKHTGMYYDPETQFRYDSKTGFYYDAVRSTYYYWSVDEHRYIQANDLVEAQEMSARSARISAARTAALRVVQEQAAAKSVGAQVAAQIAALRAEKDEYSSYAYSTCILTQEPMLAPGVTDPSASLYKAASDSIEESLILMSGINPTSSSRAAALAQSTTLYPPGCPPPPGV